MSGSGVDDAKNYCKEHGREALKVLTHFEESDARTALENIVHALSE